MLILFLFTVFSNPNALKCSFKNAPFQVMMMSKQEEGKSLFIPRTFSAIDSNGEMVLSTVPVKFTVSNNKEFARLVKEVGRPILGNVAINSFSEVVDGELYNSGVVDPLSNLQSSMITFDKTKATIERSLELQVRLFLFYIFF